MFKKIILGALLIAAFSTVAFAGEGSDTLGACKLMPELRYSYYDTPVYSHDVHISNQHLDWRAREHSAVVQLNWGVIDNLDLYIFVGGRICATEYGKIHVAGDKYEYDFDLGDGLTTGLGVRGTFWRFGNGLYLGGGASFTYALTNGKRPMKLDINGIRVWNSIDDDGIYIKEQNFAVVADLHAGWNFKNIGLTPYLGVEYRWNNAYVLAQGIGMPGHDTAVFRTEYPVGVYVGVDYLIANRLNLNLEGHMINRWGGSASIGYVFDICGAPEPEPAPAPAPVIEPKLEPMSKN